MLLIWATPRWSSTNKTPIDSTMLAVGGLAIIETRTLMSVYPLFEFFLHCTSPGFLEFIQLSRPSDGLTVHGTITRGVFDFRRIVLRNTKFAYGALEFFYKREPTFFFVRG